MRRIYQPTQSKFKGASGLDIKLSKKFKLSKSSSPKLISSKTNSQKSLKFTIMIKILLSEISLIGLVEIFNFFFFLGFSLISVDSARVAAV